MENFFKKSINKAAILFTRIAAFSFIFSTNPNKDKDVILKCPHCRHVLNHRASRDDFDVYVCKNSKCSYYLNNLASLTLTDKDKFEKNN